MRCNRRHLVGPTLGEYMWHFSKYYIIVFTWVARDKREARSKLEGFEGMFGAVPRWPKKFIIHDVSGFAREQRDFLCLLRQGSASDYKQLHPRVPEYDGSHGICVRVYYFLKWLPPRCHSPYPSLREWVINTQIICILLNDTGMFREASSRMGRREMRGVPFGEALETPTSQYVGMTRSTSWQHRISERIFLLLLRYASTDALTIAMMPAKWIRLSTLYPTERTSYGANFLFISLFL